MKTSMQFIPVLFLFLLPPNYAFAQNWHQINTGIYIDFRDIRFLNSDTGILVGRTFDPEGKGRNYRTTNAGQNWIPVLSLSEESTWINSIDFFNESIGRFLPRNLHLKRFTSNGRSNMVN